MFDDDRTWEEIAQEKGRREGYREAVLALVRGKFGDAEAAAAAEALKPVDLAGRLAETLQAVIASRTEDELRGQLAML